MLTIRISYSICWGPNTWHIRRRAGAECHFESAILMWFIITGLNLNAINLSLGGFEIWLAQIQWNDALRSSSGHSSPRKILDLLVLEIVLEAVLECMILDWLVQILEIEAFWVFFSSIQNSIVSRIQGCVYLIPQSLIKPPPKKLNNWC